MSNLAPKIATPLVVALCAVGGVLLLSVGVILGLLLTRNDQPVAAAPSPTTSATPDPADSAESAPAPAPQQQDQDLPPARFTLFSPGQHDVTCKHSPFGDPELEINWASKQSVSAWIGIDVDDAYGLVEIPVTGESDDLPDDFVFPCHQPQATFTITLVGEDGGHDSKSWTILNDGQVYDD